MTTMRRSKPPASSARRRTRGAGWRGGQVAAALLLLVAFLLPRQSAAGAVSTLDAGHFIAIAKRQMAALGVPEPSEECNSRYGSTYLARWAATGRQVCAPPPETTPTTGDADNADADDQPPAAAPTTTSSVYCAAHPGAELTTCVARNLVLSDSDAFMGTSRVAPGTVPPGLPAGAPGSVRLACRLVLTGGAGNTTDDAASAKAEALLRRRLDQDGPKQWIRAAYVAPSAGGGGGGGGGSGGVAHPRQEVAAACAGRGLGGAAIKRPVLLLTRTDGLNAFHTTEGLLSVFSALAVAAPEMRRVGILPPSASAEDGGGGGRDDDGPSDAEADAPHRSWAQAEVVLADQAWPGPFLDIWRRLAAGAGGARRRRGRGNNNTPRDGREAAAAPLVRHLASRPFPAGTCLRRAVLLPYTPHGQSLLTYTGVGSDGRCGASPVAFGAALWLRHALRGASPDGRGLLLAAAEALEREGAGGGGGEEPFAPQGLVADGVAAPTWYARYREEAEGAGGAAAALRFFGRKFGGGGGGGGGNATLLAAKIVPPYSPHLVRLKLVWISRAHYERHSAGGKGEGGGGGGGGDAGAESGGTTTTTTSSSWQRQRRLSPAAEREVVLALQEAVLAWNARACDTVQAGGGGGQAEGDDDEKEAATTEGGGSGANNDNSKPPRRHHHRRISESTTPNCRPLPVLFELEALELSDLPFWPDQAHALTRAGVVAGVHGAGLANMLLMRPGCGAVVEVWHNMRDNYHYQNLAALLAHGYGRVESEGEKVDARALAERAAAAMDRAAERHVAAARALLEERRRRRRRRRRGGDAGGGAFPWGFRG